MALPRARKESDAPSKILHLPAASRSMTRTPSLSVRVVRMGPRRQRVGVRRDPRPVVPSVLVVARQRPERVAELTTISSLLRSQPRRPRRRRGPREAAAAANLARPAERRAPVPTLEREARSNRARAVGCSAPRQRSKRRQRSRRLTAPTSADATSIPTMVPRTISFLTFPCKTRSFHTGVSEAQVACSSPINQLFSHLV
mmetsp:Transcript_18610/g.53476  ORF Transcript_18610/g.53476 Transcript_18610/m.53476 type:complete len:200 (-) Transcript_18610:2342-2941(-)